MGKVGVAIVAIELWHPNAAVLKKLVWRLHVAKKSNTLRSLEKPNNAFFMWMCGMSFNILSVHTVYEFDGVWSRGSLSFPKRTFSSSLAIVRHLRRQKTAKASEMPQS